MRGGAHFVIVGSKANNLDQLQLNAGNIDLTISGGTISADKENNGRVVGGNYIKVAGWDTTQYGSHGEVSSKAGTINVNITDGTFQNIQSITAGSLSENYPGDHNVLTKPIYTVINPLIC